MKKRNISFNPSRLTDMLDEGLFTKGRKESELKVKRENRVKWLRKKGKKDPACLGLADKLENCRPKHRCKSPACPECAYAAQRLIAKAMRRFLKDHDHEGTVCVTVAPEDGMTKPGRLDKGEHERRIRRWKEKLGKAGVTWFVGATDWSFNEHTDGRYKSHWSEHFYGLTVTKNPKKLKRKLLELFSKTDSIPRPVKVVEWDRDKKALRYILKPNFWRRVATDNAERHNKETGTMRSCRATEKARLRSKHKRELVVHLHEIGMQSRLILRCCQLVNVKEKGPTIVLRMPKSVGAKK